jgi:hypothetical protein
MQRYRYYRFILIGTVLLTSCTVYVPMQATMPLVRAKNQVEAGISVQPSTRLEATAAYSPLAHCVVAGAGTIAFRTSPKQYLITRQGEASLGGYWNIAPGWLLSTLAGGGYAYTDRRYIFLGSEQYSGSYGKVFGQVGAAYLTEQGSLSITYRLAQVYYNHVRTDTGPLEDFQTQRHELLLASRHYLGFAPSWQLQTTVGVSASSLQSPSSGGSPDNDNRWFAAGIPVPVASIGVVWQPRR